MPMSDLIAREIPYLRRYARILTGSQQLGDGLVRELLEAALADGALRADIAKSRARLFAAFSKIWNSVGKALPVGSDWSMVGEVAACESTWLEGEHVASTLIPPGWAT